MNHLRPQIKGKTKPILLFAFILWSHVWSFAQTFERLKCVGEMPDDFRSSFSDKYKTTLENTKELEVLDDKKKQSEFSAVTSIEIENLLQSGKVLYGDPVTVYCNRVLDILLKEKPELRAKVRLYTLRSNQVNAFSTQQGILCITTGLIARLHTEAELAFVLSHEVAHFEKNHVLHIYSYNQQLFERQSKKKTSHISDNILKSLQYSRNSENEADDIGFRRFIDAGYNPDAALSVFDILIDAQKVAYDEKIDFKGFEDDAFHLDTAVTNHLPEPHYYYQLLDDTLSTHPNSKERRKNTRRTIGSLVYPYSQIDFQLEEDKFREIVRRSKMELLFNCMLERDYVRGLQISQALMNDSDIPAAFLNELRSMCFYGIQRLKNNSILYFSYDLSLVGNEGVAQFLIDKLNIRELNVLASREIWKLYQKDTSNVFIRQHLDESVHTTAYMEVLYADYYDEIQYPDQPSECMGAGMRGSQYTGLKKLIYEVIARTEPTQNTAQNQPKTELGVTRMLVFSPVFFGYDLRTTVDKRILDSEKQQSYIESQLIKYSTELGIEVVIPNPKSERNSLTDDFNDFVTLMDWMDESEDVFGQDFSSFYTRDLQRIRSKYNVDYLAVVNYFQLVKRKPFVPKYLLVSVIVPYALPVYLYWQFRPYTYIGYSYTLVNMAICDIEYSEQKVFKSNYRKHIVRAQLYNSLNQIRK